MYVCACVFVCVGKETETHAGFCLTFESVGRGAGAALGVDVYVPHRRAEACSVDSHLRVCMVRVRVRVYVYVCVCAGCGDVRTASTAPGVGLPVCI